MTRDEIKARIARQLAAKPQEAHLADSALTEIFSGLDRLQALGHHFVLASQLVSQHVPQEWPKWIDGVLWQSEEHLAQGGPASALAPVVPAEPGNIDLEGKMPFQGVVLELKSSEVPPLPSLWAVLPCVHDNKILSDAQALELFDESGKHFGKFVDKVSADKYLVWLETTPQVVEEEIQAKDLDFAESEEARQRRVAEESRQQQVAVAQREAATQINKPYFREEAARPVSQPQEVL